MNKRHVFHQAFSPSAWSQAPGLELVASDGLAKPGRHRLGLCHDQPGSSA